MLAKTERGSDFSLSLHKLRAFLTFKRKVNFFVLLLLWGVGSVELEEDDVPILDNVGLALLSISPSCFDRLLGASLLPGRPVHHLGHDEALLEVGVDAPGGLWRRHTTFNDPRLKGKGFDSR